MTFINLLAILFKPDSYLVKKFLRDRTVSSIAKPMNSTTAPIMNIGSNVSNSAKANPIPINIKMSGRRSIICILLSLFKFYFYVII
ncbi:hypothetical protein [Clostridium sp. DSM 8431]|uniref:hypothetical protein n=1 Tax=Clostridium sp. DSM 8431 TaxID=1761781 RepID=UPI001A9A6B1F|nr:hypothetical protein [Clostridium sp. DSM 8431]